MERMVQQPADALERSTQAVTTVSIMYVIDFRDTCAAHQGRGQP